MVGTAITMSASTGCSLARMRPISRRDSCTEVPPRPRVGPSEVHGFEDAQRSPGRLGEPHRMQPPVVESDQLSRLDVAHERRPHDVERTGLARHHEPVRQTPDRQGAHAVGVTRRVHAALVHHHEAVGALQARQHLHRGVLEAAEHRHLVGQQGGDDVGVGRRGHAAHGDELGELVGVHEVAVVSERQGVRAVGLEDGLRVLPRGRAGGRVARVPDREVAVQGRERRLVEHLAHEPEVLVDQDVVTVAHRDAG